NEGLFGSRAVQVDRLCDEFLSGAALPGNQDSAVCGADDLNHLEEFLHHFALPDEIPHAVQFLELAPQVCVFFAEPPVLERGVHDELQLFHEIFGLEDVVERAHLERLNRMISAGECSEQDELPIETGLAKV